MLGRPFLDFDDEMNEPAGDAVAEIFSGTARPTFAGLSSI